MDIQCTCLDIMLFTSVDLQYFMIEMKVSQTLFFITFLFLTKTSSSSFSSSVNVPGSNVGHFQA